MEEERLRTILSHTITILSGGISLPHHSLHSDVKSSHQGRKEEDDVDVTFSKITLFHLHGKAILLRQMVMVMLLPLKASLLSISCPITN